MTCVSTGRAIRCWTADVWFAHSRDRGACWRQTHVAGPVGLRPAEPSVPIFVGEYQRLAALRGAVSPPSSPWRRRRPATGPTASFPPGYKFVIFEVSAKIGRHFWRHPAVPLDAEDWDRLPDRFGFDPAQEAEWRDLATALRRAVDTELTARQRQVFVAIVLNGVPLDALVLELGSNRNAIYKVLFDARRKLRSVLAANGYLRDDSPGTS